MTDYQRPVEACQRFVEAIETTETCLQDAAVHKWNLQEGDLHGLSKSSALAGS